MVKIKGFLSSTKTKIKTAITFVGLAFSTGVSLVFADDPTAKATQATETTTTAITTWSLVVAVLMVVIGGVALMFSDETRRWAKKHILWVLVGVAIIEIATSLIAWVVSTAGG